MNSKKLLVLLGAAGVAVHAAALTSLPAKAASSTSELEQLLQCDPAGDSACDAFDALAARFKDKSDHGRPDSFGPPGRPDIGPPGHYAG